MKPQILVVDDQMAVVKSWEAVLSQTGISVVGAKDGDEAWGKFQKGSFDAVVTDIRMPGTDGIELLKKIKDKDDKVQVIVFTGYGSQESARRAVELGAYEFILKPVSPQTMTDVAIRALARRGYSRDQFTTEWRWLIRPPQVAKVMRAELEKAAEKPEEEIDKQRWQELEAVIAEGRGRPGSLIPVLQKAQGIIGYLPPIVQKKIAEGLEVAVSEVFSVVTFYAFFTMKPRGRHNIRVCLGTACYVKGGREIVGKIRENLGIGIGEITQDRKFSLEAVRCLGACGLAPAIMVGPNVHGRVNPARIMMLLESYE